MVNAVLPLYLTAQVGLGVLAYGFVDGWYQGVSALVRIAGGYAGDRGGSPKWVATFGYALSAVSRIALLPAHGFAAIVGVITADRLGKGVRTAPRDALIADASEPSVLGRAFGVHRAMDTVGATLGPIVAFLLLLAAPGYGGVFVVSFAFAVVGVAVIVLFVPNLTAAKGAATTRLGNMLKEMARPRLRRLLVAVGLLSLVTVGDGFLYLSLQQRDNMAGRYFPLLFVGTNTAYFLLAIPLGRLADRVGRSKVFLGGYVALVAAYLAAGGRAHRGRLDATRAAASRDVLRRHGRGAVGARQPDGRRRRPWDRHRLRPDGGRAGPFRRLDGIRRAVGHRRPLARAAGLRRGTDPRHHVGGLAAPGGRHPRRVSVGGRGGARVSRTGRTVVLAVVILVAVVGSLGYVLHRRGVQERTVRHAPPVATRSDLGGARKGTNIVFRDTALGGDYGRAATVLLTAPSGPRALTPAS